MIKEKKDQVEIHVMLLKEVRVKKKRLWISWLRIKITVCGYLC